MEKSVLKNQKGQILFLILISVFLTLFFTLSIIGGSQFYYKNTEYSLEAENAVSIAEAGIDNAVASLNASNGDFPGEDQTLSNGDFSTSITDIDASNKIIESTGYVPSRANPKVKRKVRVKASLGEGVSLKYALQVGEGGLKMEDYSFIYGKVTEDNPDGNGNVYSNGNIDMKNNSYVQGSVFVAAGTSTVANQQHDCISCYDFQFGKRIWNNDQVYDVAQQFMPTTSNFLNKVAIKIKKAGSPPNIKIRILADKANIPDKNMILADANLSASLVSSSYSFVQVAFANPPMLTANTPYWITVDTNEGNDNGQNYWYWHADLAQGYTCCLAVWSKNWNGEGLWQILNYDLSFKVFMAGGATYIDGWIGQGVPSVVSEDVHANTIKNLYIGGCAYFKTELNIHVTNNCKYPNSPDPAPELFPISDAVIEEWKQDIENSLPDYPAINISCPPTIPAGKYPDIYLSEGCQTTIDSPVWITGMLYIPGGVTMRLASSYGKTSGFIITDNVIVINQAVTAPKVQILGSGTTGSYLMLISTFNSRDDPGEAPAIVVYLANTSVIDSYLGILYTNLGKGVFRGYGTLPQVTAWKLELFQSQIVYETGLASSVFKSGPSAEFGVIKGTYELE